MARFDSINVEVICSWAVSKCSLFAKRKRQSFVEKWAEQVAHLPACYWPRRCDWQRVAMPTAAAVSKRKVLFTYMSADVRGLSAPGSGDNAPTWFCRQCSIEISPTSTSGRHWRYSTYTACKTLQSASRHRLGSPSFWRRRSQRIRQPFVRRNAALNFVGHVTAVMWISRGAITSRMSSCDSVDWYSNC